MLIDMHAHTKGISRCCRLPFEGIIEESQKVGIEGMILTNHYQRSYVDNNDALSFAKRYIAEYEITRDYGEEQGFKVFFGIELSPDFNSVNHLLIYGVEPEFLLEYPELYGESLENIYKTVKEAGGLLVQAHPFRNGSVVVNTDYIDGVEINSHPLYGKSYCEELLEIAQKNSLIITSGGDYHADTYRPVCGMKIPKEVVNEKDLGFFLLNGKEKEIVMEEPNSEVITSIWTK